MRVRVEFTAEIADADRRAIASYYDDTASGTRLATRAECKEFFEGLGLDNGRGVLNELRVDVR